MLPQPDDELAVAHGLFSTAQARAAGHSPAEIQRRLRAGTWKSLDRGVLIAADRQPGEFDELLLAALVAGPGAVVYGRSAAQVLGWDLLADPPVPEIAVLQIPRRRDISPVRPRLVRRELTKTDVGLVGLFRVTTAARTAVDLAADLPLVDAVVAVDAAYRSGKLSPDDTAIELRSRPRMRGRPRARRVLALASPLSGSVRESEIRVRIVLAGLEAPVEQYEVVVDGVLVGRADFAWPRLMLLLEIDGFAYHSSSQAFQRDHDRQRALEDAGWRVLRFTADDVRNRPQEILESLRRAGVCENSPRNLA
ncbi:MAG TPA: DUF559 domain-containing protein [Frankiaceae bacterium]|nr:DUF559 domain-containing protein [Frankiaceae bacterium]